MVWTWKWTNGKLDLLAKIPINLLCLSTKFECCVFEEGVSAPDRFGLNMEGCAA